MERHLTRRAIKVAEAARSLDINNVAVETSYRPQKDGQTNLSEIAIIFFDPITIKLRKKRPGSKLYRSWPDPPPTKKRKLEATMAVRTPGDPSEGQKEVRVEFVRRGRLYAAISDEIRDKEAIVTLQLFSRRRGRQEFKVKTRIGLNTAASDLDSNQIDSGLYRFHEAVLSNFLPLVHRLPASL